MKAKAPNGRHHAATRILKLLESLTEEEAARMIRMCAPLYGLHVTAGLQSAGQASYEVEFPAAQGVPKTRA